MQEKIYTGWGFQKQCRDKNNGKIKINQLENQRD
jgi:hypothetical protein